jgi:hypothetical protein
MNYSLSYTILKNCCVRLRSNYNIKYVFTIWTRLNTCLMSICRFSLRDKVTLRLLKLHIYGAVIVECSRALDIRLSDWCCSISMLWAQIRRGKNKIWHLKNLIITLFGLIFRRIYNIWYLPSSICNFEIQWDICSFWLSPA